MLDIWANGRSISPAFTRWTASLLSPLEPVSVYKKQEPPFDDSCVISADSILLFECPPKKDERQQYHTCHGVDVDFYLSHMG